MGRHVFSGVSSPSCSNYTLKKTAYDNKFKYGLEAVDVLNKNFYVYDMLKLVANVSEAITLVKNVRGMFMTGGFGLTKFLRNSKELLMSIPQKYRRQEAPDKKFPETVPDNERSLGILYNIEDDKLRLQVHMKEKPLTRRSMVSSLSTIYKPLGLAAPLMVKG